MPFHHLHFLHSVDVRGSSSLHSLSVIVFCRFPSCPASAHLVLGTFWSAPIITLHSRMARTEVRVRPAVSELAHSMPSVPNNSLMGACFLGDHHYNCTVCLLVNQLSVYSSGRSIDSHHPPTAICVIYTHWFFFLTAFPLW